MPYTPSRRPQPARRPGDARYERLAPIKRRRIPRLVVIVLIIAAGLGAYYGATHRLQRPTATPAPAPGATGSGTGSQPSSSGSVTTGQPSYATVTPSGKTVEWAHLTSPTGESFYAYTDTVSGVSLRVSQQPLPDTLTSTDAVAALAASYNATRTITAGSTTVYIGSPAKNQQSLLFTTPSLLVTITADGVLNDHQWSDYISSLN